jgi:hypothetical protein
MFSSIGEVLRFATLSSRAKRGTSHRWQYSQTILDHFRFVNLQLIAANAHSNCEVLRFAQDDIHLLMRLFAVPQRALLKAQQKRLRAKDLFRESRDD